MLIPHVLQVCVCVSSSLFFRHDGNSCHNQCRLRLKSDPEKSSSTLVNQTAILAFMDALCRTCPANFALLLFARARRVDAFTKLLKKKNSLFPASASATAPRRSPPRRKQEALGKNSGVTRTGCPGVYIFVSPPHSAPNPASSPPKRPRPSPPGFRVAASRVRVAGWARPTGFLGIRKAPKPPHPGRTGGEKGGQPPPPKRPSHHGNLKNAEGHRTGTTPTIKPGLALFRL